MVYTEAQKKAIYKYRETHPEICDAVSKKHKKVYYEKNKDIIKQKSLDYYHKKKEDPEWIEKNKEHQRIMYEKNRETILARKREQYLKKKLQQITVQ
jgi:hypothetical protein